MHYLDVRKKRNQNVFVEDIDRELICFQFKPKEWKVSGKDGILLGITLNPKKCIHKLKIFPIQMLYQKRRLRRRRPIVRWKKCNPVRKKKRQL